MNLITFCDNESLLSKKDKKILKEKNNFFVGDWCTQHDNMFSFKNQKKVLDLFKWGKAKERENNHNYVVKIYEEILKNISTSLNKFHNKNYDQKYWEVLVMRWLYNYLHRTYACWGTAKKILKKHKIKSVLSLDVDDQIFIPDNTVDGRLIVDDEDNYWSGWAFTEIFKFIGNTKIRYIKTKKKINFKDIKSQSDIHSRYVDIKIFSLKDKIFIYRFNLTFNMKLKLMIKNLQFPYKGSFKSIPKNNEKKRKEFYFYKKTNDEFLNFANYFVKKNLPKIFLENYENLEKTYEKLKWPKNPKYIITSHAHIIDDVFKIYVAKKKIKGSKFLISQHGAGGHYEQHLYYDFKVCDRYLVWGKGAKLNAIKGIAKQGAKQDKKTYPLFASQYQNLEKKEFKFNRKKKLLLVVYDFSRHISYPPHGFINTLKKIEIHTQLILSLIEKLNKDLRNIIKVKNLIISKYKYTQNTILHKYPKTEFLKTNKQVYKIRKNYNLQIDFFLSTSFFESMYYNQPVILIYDDRLLYGCYKSFKKYLKILKKNNICFYNSSDASKFINKNYNNLEDWWFSKSVQNVRKLFCKNFCKDSESPIKDFERSLNIR